MLRVPKINTLLSSPGALVTSKLRASSTIHQGHTQSTACPRLSKLRACVCKGTSCLQIFTIIIETIWCIRRGRLGRRLFVRPFHLVLKLWYWVRTLLGAESLTDFLNSYNTAK